MSSHPIGYMIADEQLLIKLYKQYNCGEISEQSEDCLEALTSRYQELFKAIKINSSPFCGTLYAEFFIEDEEGSMAACIYFSKIGFLASCVAQQEDFNSHPMAEYARPLIDGSLGYDTIFVPENLLKKNVPNESYNWGIVFFGF